MRTRNEKEQVVEELVTKFKRQKIAFFTDFRGISVTESNKLRRQLRKEDTDYAVAKKTLFDLALKESGVEFTTKKLEGEIGVAMGYGDQVAPAKTLVKFAKEHESFKIVAAILGSRVLTAKDVMALAKLPSREVLLAQVVGVMQAPIRGLAVVLQAKTRDLATVLGKVRDQKTA